MRVSIHLTIALTAISSLAAVAAERSVANDPRADRSTVRAVKSFDQDNSRSIDANELAALNESYAAAPKGELAPLDRNNDGRIDAAEVALLNLGKPSAVALRTFDQDGNLKLEAEEVEALRRQFESDPSGPLKAFDRNGDSRLDDDEIARINRRLGRTSARKPKSQASIHAPALPVEPPSDSGSGSASLSWQRPTMNEDGTPLTNLGGFVIRYGRSPGALTNRIAVNDPKRNEYVIDGLGPGMWYFSVSTITTSGTESAAGPVVSKAISSEGNSPD